MVIDSDLTKEQAIEIGKDCKDALPGNMLIGAFAASLIDENYPLNKSMWDIIFEIYSSEELGRAFEKWVKENNVQMTEENLNGLQETSTKN